MAVRIDQSSVQGTLGEAQEGDNLTASANLVNDGTDPVKVSLSFQIDGTEAARTDGSIDAGASGQFSMPVGQLTVGGHTLGVVVGVDDGSSSAQVDHTAPFTVTALPLPTAEVGSIHIQPHSNVEHPAGHAWSNEKVRVSVLVHNTGTRPLSAEVLLDIGGHVDKQEVQLAAGEQKWVSSDGGPFAVGVHQITASASTEASNQSVLLGSANGTLTVSEPTAGWHPVNVQIVLHDFRQRPMDGRAIFVEFTGMDSTKAGGAETVEGTAASGGILSRPQITIPPRGAVRIMAVSTGAADEPIENTAPYHLADGQNDLSITANQEASTAKVTAKSIQGVRDKLSAEMSAGVEIEVLSVGGKMGAEHEESQQFEQDVEWDVRYGRPSFAITVGN
jgi:hypothetical protein